MTNEPSILQVICHGLQEHFKCIRCEDADDNTINIFFYRVVNGFCVHKHACVIRLNGGYLYIIPGSLLRRQHVDRELKLELTDPTSIGALIDLLGSCKQNDIVQEPVPHDHYYLHDSSQVQHDNGNQ